MQKDFKLPSGAVHHVSSAPFADAYALAKALLKSAKGLPITEDMMKLDVSVLKDAILNAAVSDDVEAAAFKCLERSTYDNATVDRALFDDPKVGDAARKDFYQMAQNVIEVDAMPFFEQALSSLKTVREKITESPKQS